MMAWLYKRALKPILFRFSPDLVHDVFVQIGILSGKFIILKKLISFFYGAPQEKTPLVVDGIPYYGKVLLSAGFDYNAHLSAILWEMGFAGEEVGSVTARVCHGNPPPRLTRLVNSNSIQVYKGLKNDGVDAVIERLKKKKIHPKFVVGISIAKTNDQLCASSEEGIKDYCYSFRRLNENNLGHFYTINISCPNSFGGEDFAKPEQLRWLLSEIKKIPCQKPIYLKMPINLPWNEFDELLKIIVEFKINGVVIGNLNKDYKDADDQTEPSQLFRGGLSGKPCQRRSNELIQKTRAAYPELTIMGCGGILSTEDADKKLKSGANLLQLISGMIFTGPHLMGEINSSLKNR